MGEPILQYFEKIATLFSGVQVTDSKKRSLDFSEGLSAGMDIILTQTSLGRKVIFIGNGGSAAIASHLAVDYWKNGGMRAIAFNDSSLLTCVSNDFGYPQVFAKPFEMFADAGDVLVAISSSGRSENILLAVNVAKEKACKVITMAGFSADTPLRFAGDLNFYVPSDTYGHVEIVHLALCHCILDTIISRQGRE
ncbi:MAG: SIS domain-containing protein [Nitrospiraceae bacterium]|jgi:D-sedoheptulose 7-phosphate isomerase|nr:SIS domain-containing protein [candidate division NC10 bacterium]